jgi:hypothetical protein
MLIRSSPGRRHAYWKLAQPVGVDELEQANRRLAHHLGGDLASTDAARILRPAGTLSHKHEPPTPVTLLDLDWQRVYDVDELVDTLPDPPGKARRPGAATSPRRDRSQLDQQLLAIPATDYVRELTGLEPNRAGKVHCPFHADHTPSLQLYADGTWCCFAAHGSEGRIGGTIYDFAARLWLTGGTKGRAFLELRARLAERFGIPHLGPE